MKKYLAAFLLFSQAAFAQSLQLAPGQIVANDTAAARQARASNLTALIDRAFNTNQGSVFNRGPTVWASTRTPVLGLAGTATGTLGFSGLTSGTMTVSPQSVAGTGTLLLPNLAGTIVAGASSPLVASATTGVMSCPTCVTSSGGGAITGSAPITVSAAGVVSITSPLPLTNGGTNASLTAAVGAIPYSTASAIALLAPTATARLPLLSGASAAPVWGAFTLPASVISGGVACYTSTSAAASSALLTANALVLGGGAGVCPGPMASLGTTATVLHGNAAGAPTFGAVVNADMATMVDGTIKSNISGGTAVPADNTITLVFDKLLGTTQGSLAYRSGSAWVPLTPGSSGQLLQSGGPATNPSWVTAGGAGTVTSVAAAGLAVASPAPITTTGTITVTAASSAQQIAASSNAVAVTPSVQQNHPSAIRASGRVTNGGAAVLVAGASYNAASATRTALGVVNVVMTTTFATSSTTWFCIANSVSPQVVAGGNSGGSIGTWTFTTRNITGAADIDADFNFMCQGY